MIILKYFLIAGLCFDLAGCASPPEKPFVEPQYGMTKQQLVELLGEPETREIYEKSDKTRIEFYIYNRIFQSSLEKVPVCLVDNKVVGWGRTFYEDHVSTDLIRIK